MSRRGLLPLIAVTCVGVAGGMYTFGPLMKENSYEARQRALKETTEAASASKISEEELKRVATVEAAASRNASTESALSPKSSSWWPKIGLWSGGENTKDASLRKTPTEAPNPEKKN